MDENQVGTLGTKMRDAYNDIASDRTVLTEDVKKRTSRRLRKARNFARQEGRKAAGKAANSGDSFVSQHPTASLLIATGIGYVLSRLMHR